MLTKRIIACLDVQNGVVVKGVKFRNHEVVGQVLDLAKKYRDEGADELVFYEISASPDGRRVSSSWIAEIAKILDIPFCVAGGIRTIADAEEILHAGADKISVNSPALENPSFISELAKRFGTQCVVVGVDSKRENGEWCVYRNTGDPSRTEKATIPMLSWIHEAENLGAGEIVLNCMDSDGTGEGFDIEQLKAARARLGIPLVASGGAKKSEHFERVFREAGVDAALAAGAFHRGELRVPDVKDFLAQHGIPVRRIDARA